MHECTFSEKLMGSSFEIALVTDDASTAPSIFAELYASGLAFEKRFSRFLPDSELSHLNMQKDLIVSEEFMAVFDGARTLSTKTEGIFNPLANVSALGYDTSFETITEATTSPTIKYSTDLSTIAIDRKTRRITLKKNQNLDFGGFLKGHVAELLAERIFAIPTVKGIILNIGGDLCTRGIDIDNETFKFSLLNPLSPSEKIDITLKDTSLSTSGSYKRMWQRNGTPIHHIVEPKAQKNPQTDIISASVISTNGALSDALATSCVVLGSAKAPELLSLHKCDYTFILSNGQVINTHNHQSL